MNPDRIVVFILVFVILGCQMAPPTKITESHKREFVQVTAKAQKPLAVSEDTVVLDARSSFAYGLNHIRGSLLFSWTNLAEDGRTGQLLRDPHQAALRLSLLGLKPTTPVLVVGAGPDGNGDEGRLAWNLLYLGFQDVQVAQIEELRPVMTNDPSPPLGNVLQWPVNVREDLVLSRQEFLNAVERAPKEGPGRVVVIDVRSAKEYLTQGESPQPAYNVMNIEWKEFYTTQSGRPDFRMARKLAALNITPETHVITISNRGVRSASAAYALLAMGFSHVQNFNGGWLALH